MTTTSSSGGRLGVFAHNEDIGAVAIPGRAGVEADALAVTGSGHNMWLAEDQFHFVWTEVEGDWSLSATAHFEGEGANAHRKAVVLVREGLATDARYAGAALHGDGLTSLQYRSAAGAQTEEIRFSTTAPSRLTLRKQGTRIEALAGDESHAVELPLAGTYFIGVGVCSHVDDVSETVDFTDIQLARLD